MKLKKIGNFFLVHVEKIKNGEFQNFETNAITFTINNRITKIP